MGAKPSVPKITTGQLNSQLEVIRQDKIRLQASTATHKKYSDQTINDIILFLTTMTQIGYDVFLYQYKNLANLQLYLKTLSEQITDLDQNIQLLPQKSEQNKREILDTYNYIYLYTYCNNQAQANSMMSKYINPLKQRINN